MRRRRKAREIALQHLYAMEISGNSIDMEIEQIRSTENLDEEICEFALSLLRKVHLNCERLDQDVSVMVQNWDYERIALLDRLILRQALGELIYFEEIPPKVTINEAIDLAKKFSTAESGRFVNGVLDGLYKKLRDEQRIMKAGRGLIDTKK